jgi:uncharacterized protein YecE (DUF72 family)
LEAGSKEPTLSSRTTNSPPAPGAIVVGTAGWSLPREAAAEFPEAETNLARYAGRFSGVEINSSFHRPHRPATYTRWAAAVPESFRFALKVPKEITHKLRLVEAAGPLERFLAEASGLGDTLGPLLIQLPPSLEFDSRVVETFFGALRERFTGSAVCEPRHPSWFGPEAERVFVEYEIARVAADPAPVPEAAIPAGWAGLVYYRLHGSPRRYYSAYEDDFLDALARDLRERSRSARVWCIFDNTASGAATGNALRLNGLLE